MPDLLQMDQLQLHVKHQELGLVMLQFVILLTVGSFKLLLMVMCISIPALHSLQEHPSFAGEVSVL
jgi:hypothetical protein